jgi:outer membrane protein TolC
MRFIKYFLSAALLIFYSTVASAQQLPQRSILSFSKYKSVLQQNHPVLGQANIMVDNAQQEILRARGGFDPKLSLGKDNKNFENKQYYDYRNIKVDIPTWLGVDVVAGYNNNNGLFTNDEVTLGNSYYLGGNFSVTQSLFMNKRRATLEKAKLLRTSADEERKLIINQLYFQAYTSYFNWLNEFLKYKTFNDIYNLNLTRYDLVRNTWKLGKSPAIDTTEALSQLQQFKLFRNQSYINWIEAGIELSQHIWDSSLYVQLVQAKVMPDSMSISELSVNDSLSSYWNSFTENHPILSINDLKQEQLRIQQKLAYQQLLPDISLGGYKINRAANSILSTQDLNSNYQFNIGLDVPLRLSKGRAEVSINKNQLLQTQLKRDYDQRKIENQVLYQLNEINIAKSQISLYDQYLGNISKLYRAENIKYTLGSSTIFLINSRENKLLDIRLKRLENLIKYQNAILKLYKEVARMEEL